jgi:hypothetical protein
VPPWHRALVGTRGLNCPARVLPHSTVLPAVYRSSNFMASTWDTGIKMDETTLARFQFLMEFVGRGSLKLTKPYKSERSRAGQWGSLHACFRGI